MKRVGRRAFNNCDVKLIEFKDHVFINGYSGSHVVSKNPTEDGRVYMGSTATLHCPRTEDERVRVEQGRIQRSQTKVLNDLRNLAGELLCHDCRFSNMSPAEVSIDRAKFAVAEAERIKAFGLRAEAIQELKNQGLDWQITGPADL